jgi:formylmethanofuran dehydrogenase subunit E
MSSLFDPRCVTDALQMIADFIHGPGTLVAKERGAVAAQTIIKALEQVGAEINRQHRLTSEGTDISLTLYTARELERYIRGEKTTIVSRRSAEVYYRVLRAGIEQLPQLERDLDG